MLLGALTRGAIADPSSLPKTPAALPIRNAEITLDNRIVRVTMTYRDVIDAEITKKLTSGLPTTVVMRGYVFRETGGDPIALTAKTCRIVYDLWDEIFRIQIT